MMNRFNKITYIDFSTDTKLKRKSIFFREYKNHTITFTLVRDKAGKPWYSVKVWRNEGKERIGAFALRGGVATDDQAFAWALQWAKENIDAL